jgi:hypothetical protein
MVTILVLQAHSYGRLSELLGCDQVIVLEYMLKYLCYFMIRIVFDLTRRK